jgi:DNA-binding transcriptional LysR family regulator
LCSASEHEKSFVVCAKRRIIAGQSVSCFTAAARALGLTQAAVSQRVHALERLLAVLLFDRHGGRVLLTEAGQRLYPYAEQILRLHEEARQQVTGRKAPLSGNLTLAASSIPGCKAAH